jgi:hypothetical protein
MKTRKRMLNLLGCFVLLLILVPCCFSMGKKTESVTEKVNENVSEEAHNLVFGHGLEKGKKRKLEKRFKFDENTGVLSVFDDGGVRKKEIQFQRYIEGEQSAAVVSVSDNGEYICASSLKMRRSRNQEEREKGGASIESSEVSVWDRSGKKLWNISNTGFQFSFVSPNGKWVVGKMLGWECSPIRMAAPNLNVVLIGSEDYNGGFHIAMNPNGKGVGVVFSSDEKNEQRGIYRRTVNIRYFDDKGLLLWERKRLLNASEYSGVVEATVTNDIFVVTILRKQKKPNLQYWIDVATGQTKKVIEIK